jgi:uncharacterized membrane protein YfcA
MLPAFTPFQWVLAALAAFCIGFSKGGFPGSGLVTVIVMAHLFGARESTGALLPMLICGDILSVRVFHQHARWALIRRMLPPTAAGIVAGWGLMQWLPADVFRPIIGWIVLAMAILPAARRWRPDLYAGVPHSRAFALAMGFATGVATMLANAAGPVMGLYLMAISTPKFELVGTSAWFFLIVNLFKVPFSAQLGLIHGMTLAFNLILIPFIALGIFAGRRLMPYVSQALFEALLLAFATIASLRMILFSAREPAPAADTVRPHVEKPFQLQ